MKATDAVRLTGRLQITVRDVDTGMVVATRKVENLVVLDGRNLIRDLLGNATSDRLTHMAVGTSGTAAAAGDSTLGAEVYRDALTQVDASVDGELTVLLYLPSTAANGSTLQEAGVFTASSGGTMFSRATYTSISKTSSIAVTYDWTFTIGAS